MTVANRPLDQQAGILCNTETFQRFAAIRCGIVDEAFGPSAAAQYLRQQCRIQSRTELKNNHGAQDRYKRLLTEFDAWRGRIASQR